MRVVALDDDRRRLDAGLVPRRLFDQLDFELSPLRPARVHSEQHARPVAALGAAGPGMHFDIAVVGVGLARKQRFKLAPFALGLERPERRDSLGFDRVVALGLAKVDQRRRVVEVALNFRQRAQPVFQHRALAHHLFGEFGIGPEIGIFGFRVQFGQTPRRCIDVKDASSAVPRTA